MRKYLIAALTLVVALGLTAVAFAVQQQTADIKLNQKKTSSPTAIDSTFKVSDPDNHNPGEDGKPTRQINRVDIVFPKGTKFNSAYNPKGKPECKQTNPDAIVKLCGKSKLANGTTSVDGRNGPLLGIINAKLLAYNAHNGLAIIVSAPGTLADKQVLFPKLHKNKLITDLPNTLQAVNAYLTDFHLLIPSLKHKSGKGKKAKTKYYATTPKTCPKNKKWVIKVKYYFVGGGTFTTPGTVNKCTPPKKKHKKHKK